MVISHAASLTIKKHKKEGGTLLGKWKMFENILKAASALVAAAMSIVKFVTIIGKMKPSKA